MYFRKIIRIRAEDSPNVRAALAQQRRGLEPDGVEILPGVIDWPTYKYRRTTWDPILQTVSLDGEFYEGAAVMLYPADWRRKANTLAARLSRHRDGKAIGIDPAEGGDSSCWSVIDKKGLIHQESMKTPDTSIIPANTLRLMNKYNVMARNVMFDRGGGGKQHADAMRKMGHRVNDVSFGEKAGTEITHMIQTWESKTDDRKESTVYKNRRAQMYHLLRHLLDPDMNPTGFGIPKEYEELDRQMAPMPVKYNEEGILYLPPKQKRDDKDTRETIHDILGCSPDELDSLVLAVWGLSGLQDTVATGAALF